MVAKNRYSCKCNFKQSQFSENQNLVYIHILFYCFRSETTGNCLYSSISLLLVGNNSLVETLRCLTSLELHQHASFYSKHPTFTFIFTNHRNVFASMESILKISVSHKTLDTGLSSDEAVKEEAINNCHDKAWSSFLCILGLSSVIQRSIHSLYPDFGLHRNKVLFNQLISPRVAVSSTPLFILFCRDGPVVKSVPFQSNHFVPLIYSHKSKRKSLAVPSRPSKVNVTDNVYPVFPRMKNESSI